MTLDEFEELVAEISERAFCAQWRQRIELDLWLIVVGARSRTLGQTTVADSELQHMREHLQRERTWIAWEGKPVLVPLPEWLTIADRLQGFSMKPVPPSQSDLGL